MKILNIQNLKFDQVILIYLKNMWINKLNYKQTLIQANHYYETSPYVGKNNQKDPQRNKYKSMSHGYCAFGGSKSKGNVVMYHHNDQLQSVQPNFKGLGDNVASSIWQHVNQFGDEVNNFFDEQFAPMNYVFVQIQGYFTKIHQMHFSKNSYIKPHIDKYDMDASLIAWFTKGNRKGGCFGVLQQCLKFDTNNRAGIFVRSKLYAYETLRFQEKSLKFNVYKVGVAFVNKQQLNTRIRNLLREGAPLIWKNN